jgi:hypothetical protein
MKKKIINCVRGVNMQDLGYNLENLDLVFYSTRIERLAACEGCHTDGCDLGCSNGCGTCKPGCSAGVIKK